MKNEGKRMTKLTGRETKRRRRGTRTGKKAKAERKEEKGARTKKKHKSMRKRKRVKGRQGMRKIHRASPCSKTTSARLDLEEPIHDDAFPR